MRTLRSLGRSLRAALGVGLLAIAAFVAPASGARAEAIAVFGNNSLIPFINSMPGYTATLVTDAQIATPGFLGGFDAFVYTRDGFSFGNGLSAGAVAQVQGYVGQFPNLVGNVVLFNSDIADSISGAEAAAQQLIRNAVQWAASSGRGFVGEFSGTVSALNSNSDAFNPLALIPGAAGPLGFGNGGSNGSMNLETPGIGHPVTAGVSFPLNLLAVEFGATATGVPTAFVLSTFDGGNPAIIAVAGVPEPATLAVFGLMGIAGAAYGLRRRKAVV